MSAAKDRGTRWESLIVRALGRFFGGRFGLAPRRVAQQGFNDTGDIHGISPFVIQAKAYKDLATALRLGVAGAVVQAERAGEDYGVAVIKKPRGAIGEAYAVMRLEDWARVLLRLRRAEENLRDTVSYPLFAYDDPVGEHEAETEKDLAAPFPTAADLDRERRAA